MKLVLLTLLFGTFAWAKPTVLVTYFDPFGKAQINNSETVAGLLMEENLKLNNPYEMRFCKLQTKFDVSFDELRECLKALPKIPDLVIGLGEAGCELKVETMGRNLDRTIYADNAGEERQNTPIVIGGAKAIGFNYPLPEMYCSLSEVDRKMTEISSNAGSFVCNNLAYQTTWFEEDLTFGLIHVPNHNCHNLAAKNPSVVTRLLKMFASGILISTTDSKRARLPVMKADLQILRSETKNDACLSEFYKRSRAFDDNNWFTLSQRFLRQN